MSTLRLFRDVPIPQIKRSDSLTALCPMMTTPLLPLQEHQTCRTGCVVLSCGVALPRRAPLRMYLFGAAKGHKGPRAILKSDVGTHFTVLLIVRALFCRKEGCRYKFLWSKCLLSFLAVVLGRKTPAGPGVLATDVAHSARAPRRPSSSRNSGAPRSGGRMSRTHGPGPHPRRASWGLSS